MKLDHINKIKANISIFSRRKTFNLLDGTYKSIYRGRSMDFDNLREYVINDDVKDIEWKSSARSGTLLIKQFIAEKKHNILIVVDSGIKMNADTESLENKKELATYIAGTIGYLAVKNGDYVGLSYYDKNNKIEIKPFKDNLYALEEYLCCYERSSPNVGVNDSNKILEYIYKHVTKKMIIFYITDIAGLDSLDNKVLKKISGMHDFLVINISDNYVCNENVFDIENKKYIPKFFADDKILEKMEKEIREELLIKNQKKLKKDKICMVSVKAFAEIELKIIRLLEEHRYASNN